MVQKLRDVYTERRQLVTQYSRARCDTTHAYVVPTSSSQLTVIRVHRGLSLAPCLPTLLVNIKSGLKTEPPGFQSCVK